MAVYKWSHVPAFGTWDYANDLPITQYFESARHPAFLPYYSSRDRAFYGHDLKAPPRTVVPRRKRKVSGRRYRHVKEQKRQVRVSDLMEQPLPQQAKPPPPPPPRAPKAVDEDLYKIPPELLHTNPRRKKMLGFFSRCLVPTCVV